ncbi:MAG: hypothetical protein RJQ09_21315 [Cyclobacteriaceae bacterium]
MEAQIFRDLETRLAVAAVQSHFTDNAQAIPTRLEMFDDQYTREEENEGLPKRPFLLLEFGEYEERDEGSHLFANVPFTLHVVQDNYVRGSTKSNTKPDYLKKLRYPELVRNVFLNQVVSCGRIKNLKVLPEEIDNMLVHKISGEVMNAKRVRVDIG